MLSIGIVGLPNVGKSTLFNALTRKSVPAENFPFCTIDPSVGVVEVPDERIITLSKISQSQKTIPTAIEFVDIAGLVSGASSGEGLGNKFLANIRETDAICQVVRIFDDPNITHVSNTVDPLSDIEVIGLELILADLQTVTKKLPNLEKEAKRGDKDAQIEYEVLKKVEGALTNNTFAHKAALSPDEFTVLKRSHLITAKPMLYALNKKSGAYNLDEKDDPRWQKLHTFLKENGYHWVIIDANIERELSEISKEEQQEYRESLGVFDDGINKLIQTGYVLLNLITFFTTGPAETRARTITKGVKAPEAGAAIHSDFRDKFIRASVVAYEELKSLGSMAAVKEKGVLRTEGKEYIVQDGDIIEFFI